MDMSATPAVEAARSRRVSRVHLSSSILMSISGRAHSGDRSECVHVSARLYSSYVVHCTYSGFNPGHIFYSIVYII